MTKTCPTCAWNKQGYCAKGDGETINENNKCYTDYCADYAPRNKQ